jgi:hypothetical protein
VTILERSPVALAHVAAKARRTGLPVTPLACDLEQPDVAIPAGPFAGIVMTYFKAAPLLPRLAKHLTPGGLLVVEGFTVTEAARKGSSPEHYWHKGELPALLSGLSCLEYHEAWLRGRHRAWGAWQSGEAYRAMDEDETREAEALERAEVNFGDVVNDAR